MPAKKRKVNPPKDDTIKNVKPPPQLPLDVIDRIYATFEPVTDIKDRNTLAFSLRVCKSFHDIVAPLPYREVGLNWLINKGYSWKNATYGKYAKLPSQRRRANFLSPAYLQYVRYIFAHDHTHKRLSHSKVSSPTAIDVLEIQTRTPWQGESTHRWCNKNDPVKPGDRHPALMRCHGLEQFQPKLVILNLRCLINKVSRDGPFGIPRFPASSASKTERLILRPEFCSDSELQAWTRLRLGHIPSSVTRVDIVLERSSGTTYLGAHIRPAGRACLLEALSSIMFDHDTFIPDSCSVCIVNISQLGANIDPNASPSAARSSGQIQDAVEAKIGQLIVQAHGDTPATKAKRDRLKFISLEEYAEGLRGMEKKCLSAAAWESLRKSSIARSV